MAGWLLLLVVSVAGLSGYFWPFRRNKPTRLDEHYDAVERGRRNGA
jgi:hypothetical protein